MKLVVSVFVTWLSSAAVTLTAFGSLLVLCTADALALVKVQPAFDLPDKAAAGRLCQCTLRRALPVPL
jgi:hypothetical protein